MFARGFRLSDGQAEACNPGLRTHHFRIGSTLRNLESGKCHNISQPSVSAAVFNDCISKVETVLSVTVYILRLPLKAVAENSIWARGTCRADLRESYRQGMGAQVQ